MKRIIVLAAAAAMLSACQSAQESVGQKEDMLAAAGFQVQPANSPARLAAMKSLPPHKFVRQTKGTSITYVYVDPTVCNCVYFGSQTAWSSYQAMAFQNRITDEQRMIALASPNAFDFGPWDPIMW